MAASKFSLKTQDTNSSSKKEGCYEYQNRFIGCDRFHLDYERGSRGRSEYLTRWHFGRCHG